MKRARLLALSCVGVLGAMVACADLFEDPSQCKSDRDCTKFGAVCDVTRAVCVAPGSLPADEGGILADGGEGGADATDESPPLPPDCTVNPKPTAEIVGNPFDGAGETEISDMLVDCTKDWTLKTRVYVKAGATITIQAGVTIRASANAGLVIRPGGKILAQGTRDNPIVFTSAAATPAPGDWSGLIVLGTAPPANTYPGADGTWAFGGANGAGDDNGTLQFVRVEYARNGIVLAGLGSASKIDSLESRKTVDNCFAIHGGRWSGKHLVCQFPGDEMFEIGTSYQGKLQYLYGTRTPATGGGHHGLLVENNAFPVIYNTTVCGVNAANQGQGFIFRNNARFDVNNAIFQGWNSGMDAVGTLGTPISLRTSVFANNAQNPAFIEDDAGTGDTLNDDNLFDEVTYFQDGGTNSTNDPWLVDCYDQAAPKPWPGATITGPAPPDDGFFDKSADFIGAFRDSNEAWIKGSWVRFSGN